MKLFSVHYKNNSGSISKGIYVVVTSIKIGTHVYTIDNLILQKGDGELRMLSGILFKQNLIDYFKDCPDLVKKIDNNEFGFRDMELIVNYYNSNCR